tara:strand:- start:2674 stop:3138 length:465 start_codon:yes stop_codon:yes gene_type:complete
VAIGINWRSILKREEKPRVRTLSNGKKYLFISEGRAYRFIKYHPILGDRTGRKQKGAMIKPLSLEEIRNDISKAKAKVQEDLDEWTDEEWGSQKQHKARARGETPPPKSTGRFMPKKKFQSTSQSTLNYQDKKKREGTKRGKQHIPTGKKFSQK